ncbi:hypothetical protein [Anaeroselena agilis]|uniref:Carboxypeptidase regulatory-like domain-containing protein n=1 Tax=Anaeroselena agilis TaxID=3063788 RepID=A0ABU3NY94_9FIRM|nr:hypothetical protein [Selenomonadales bacterium 4137-cl]
MRSFLAKHMHMRIMLGTIGGFIITGTLIRFTRKTITLRDAQILSAGEEPINLHILVQREGSIMLWGLPENIPADQQIVLTGQIFDNDADTTASGALVKVMLLRSGWHPQTLGFTYSGRDGWYMFPLRRDKLFPNDRIMIQVVGPDDSRQHSDCNTPQT